MTAEEKSSLSLSDYQRIRLAAKALSSETRLSIVIHLQDKEMDITSIARHLGQTEANTSAQVKMLEQNGLLKSRYEPGEHGVRKVVSSKVDKLIFNFV